MRPTLKNVSTIVVVLAIGVVVGAWWFNPPRVQSGAVVSRVTQGKQELRFFALGDTGSGGEGQWAVARAMEARCASSQVPDGILLLGDNVYSSGVHSVDDVLWQDRVFAPYGLPCLSQVRIYPVLGNHDYKGDPAAQILMTERQPRWFMPHRFYALEFDDLLEIVAFDSNFHDVCGLSNLCAVDFLRARLKNSSARWRVVMAHHPLYSASALYPRSAWPYRALIGSPVCESADVFLAGHAHHLEHTQRSSCDAEFFVAGGGGADLYEVRPDHPDSLFVRSEHGFLEVVVGRSEMQFVFWDSEANRLYEYHKKKA